MNSLIRRTIKSFLYRSSTLAYRVFPKKAVLAFYCYLAYVLRAVTWRLACTYYGQAMAEHRGDVPEFVMSQIKPDDAVIDVGCAVGHLTRFIAKKAGRVVAIDIDRGYLDRIDKNEKGLEKAVFINGDIMDLKFDETFDAAVLVHTIEHMDNAGPALRKISEIARKIVVETPDQESDWLSNTLTGLGIEEQGDDKHVKLYNGASLKEELERNGWTDVILSKSCGAVRAVALSEYFKQGIYERV